MRQEITIRDIADLERAAAEFLEKIGNNTLVAFFAPMGSGKTTFTTALCKVLGVTDPVGSPTFAIVNEYMRADGEPMYHFDFYRINKLEEAIEIGLYDYLDSGYLCIMEWPENIEDLLPEDTLYVRITVNPDQSRTLSWDDAL
jgi:tRNA threonylcarbamoyladenosine biosynthesis protein TsaE